MSRNTSMCLSVLAVLASASATLADSDEHFTGTYGGFGAVHEWDGQDYYAYVRSASRNTVLIDFYADWCGPCRRMHPILEKAAAFLGRQVTIVRVNIEMNRDLAEQFGVRALPTLILVHGRTVLRQTVGFTDLSDLLAFIRGRSAAVGY